MYLKMYFMKSFSPKWNAAAEVQREKEADDLANGGRRKKKEVKREKEQIRDSRAGQKGMAKLRMRQLTFLLQTLCMCVCSVRVSIFLLFLPPLTQEPGKWKTMRFSNVLLPQFFHLTNWFFLASQFSLTFFPIVSFTSFPHNNNNNSHIEQQVRILLLLFLEKTKHKIC